jgi:acyl-CoA synthetase (AMP-forming)/AMP-acid ligase II
MLTHGNLLSAAAAICQYLENTSDDVILNALPLSFTYGLGQVTTAFLAGATVILERPTYPAAFVETIARERVTGLPLVPTLATLLLQQDLQSRQFPDLRYITNAAAALSVPKIRQLRQAFPQARIYSMYGQTECQRASYLPAEQIDSRPTSVGIAIPGTEAWIVDDRGARVPPGVTGELVIRGPHVMSGYWRQPEETARSLRPGPLPAEVVLYTGDLFRMDREGFLYFVERKDDVIKTRGEKVAPRQVEEVIARLSGVAEVSVYGVPDDLLGEAIVASVTLSPGSVLSRAMIQRYCLTHLDAYMVPQTVDIRDALPTTPSGKVSRRMLRVQMQSAEKVCG